MVAIIYSVLISCYCLQMRLRDALVPIVAIGLPLAACGEPQATNEAKVSGFDHTLTVDYEETRWEQVTDASYPPDYSENVRDVRSHVVEGECHEVSDPFFQETESGVVGDEPDDGSCWGDFWCSTQPGDPTHCVKSPDTTKWNYEQKVWRNIGTCAVTPRAFEMKYEEPREDSDCIKVFEALPKEGERRSFKKQRFIVRASIIDDKEKLHYAFVDLPTEVWASIKPGDCISVTGPESNYAKRSFKKLCD
jgi:hypothetical protein